MIKPHQKANCNRNSVQDTEMIINENQTYQNEIFTREAPNRFKQTGRKSTNFNMLVA